MAADNDDLFGAPSWADVKPKPASTPPAGAPATPSGSPSASPVAPKPAPTPPKSDDLFGAAPAGPAPAARVPASAPATRTPVPAGVPPKPAAPAGTPPANPSASTTASPATNANPNATPPPLPTAPSELGKDPRRASAMRGKLASIFQANKERHAAARREHRGKLLDLEFDRRLRSLVNALREITSFDGLGELQLIARRPAPLVRYDLSAQPVAPATPPVPPVSPVSSAPPMSPPVAAQPPNSPASNNDASTPVVPSVADLTALPELRHVSEYEIAPPDGAARPASAASMLDRRCNACRHDLRGLPSAGRCPACGAPYGEGPTRDFFAGDLYEHLLSKLRLTCTACQYSLRGLKAIGTCPECGVPYRTNAVEWTDLARAISREMVLAPTEITSNTYVLARLWQLTAITVDNKISRGGDDEEE